MVIYLNIIPWETIKDSVKEFGIVSTIFLILTIVAIFFLFHTIHKLYNQNMSSV